MIRWWLAFILVLAPVQVLAQAAQVTSGDHADFTRIVVQYPGVADWKVGRTADGYELRLPQTNMRYDLTKAFDLIQKNRLAAIFADPQTGALHLSIACACYAIPFEFRPGTVVIDIRDGEPPKGSEFELPFDQREAKPVEQPAVASETSTPTSPGYDWTTLALGQEPKALPIPLAEPPAEEKQAVILPDLEPLRQSLIEQLSRGASAGIVDMAKPEGGLENVAEENPDPSVHTRLADEENLILRQKGEASRPMTAEGDVCYTDQQVDVAGWYVSATESPGISTPEAGSHGSPPATAPAEHGAAAPASSGHGEGASEAPTSLGDAMDETIPISMQFSPAMANLTGEFDRPDPEAVTRAVRFNLFLSFGAEARALLRAFPIEAEDKAIWESMARITDEEPDPDPAFAGMEACDTAAALWAVLADPKVLGVGQVQKSAILRAFSALPPHLRHHLGPTLVDRFLAMDDLATATVLRDAVARGNPAEGPVVEMMQAAIDKASGSPGASMHRLETVAESPGPSNAEAMAALIIQRAELGQDVTYDQVRSMEEFAQEHEGSTDHEVFERALTLAYAASGDFDKAFANLAKGPDAAPTVWNLLGNAAPESALLNHAMLEGGETPPRSSLAAASLIANRMLGLGFADQAATWFNAANEKPPILAARIAVAQGRPKEALTLLGDLKSAPAIDVRLEALRQQGDDLAIAALFAELGMTEERWTAISRTQDWDSLAKDGPDVWKAAAAKVTEVQTEPAAPADTSAAIAPPMGPLAQGQSLVDNSASTRDAITALLDSVKSPAVPSQ